MSTKFLRFVVMMGINCSKFFSLHFEKLCIYTCFCVSLRLLIKDDGQFQIALLNKIPFKKIVVTDDISLAY